MNLISSASLKEKIKNFISTDYAVLILIAGITFFACFYYFKSFGIYGDDWDAGTYWRFNSLNQGLHYWWSVWAGEVNNFRPLAAALPIMWFYSFKMFGLPGVFLSIYLVHALLGFLIYKFFSKITEKDISILGALFFVLYPTNNAYLWQVATSYVLSLCFIMGAVLAYKAEKRKLIAIILLFISLLINEAPIMLFFMVLIPEQKISLKEFWESLKKFLLFFLPIVFVYAFARISAEHANLIVGGRTKNLVGSFHLFAYIFQFLQAVFVVTCMSWVLAVWKMVKDFHAIGYGAWLIAGLEFFIIRAIIFNKSFLANTKEKIENNFFYFFIAGLLLIIAGRYYGFYFQPSINTLNLDSRYYYAASFGGVVMLVGVMLFFKTRFPQYWKYTLTFFISLIAFLSVFKHSVQLDYANSWTQAKIFWQQFVKQYPSLKDGELAIVYVQPRELGHLVGVGEAIGDLRKVFPYVYKSNVYAVTTFLTQSINFEKDAVCINSHPFWENKCFSTGSVDVLEFKNQNLTIKKPANNLLGSKVNYISFPEGLKNIILK